LPHAGGGIGAPFDIIFPTLRWLIQEEFVKNVDVKVSVDVRVDPVGVAILLASAAMALFLFKKNKEAARSLP
jgi:hypothetical protein